MRWAAQRLKGREAARVAVAASTNSRDRRCERSQQPAARMVSPKAVALINRPASSGSMPTQPKAASSRGTRAAISPAVCPRDPASPLPRRSLGP